jgi:signal transduction histidine kinase
MIPRSLRGLRGRLLLALVATSAVTLAVAAAVTLSPLQARLRQQSESNLENAIGDSIGDFQAKMKPRDPADWGIDAPGYVLAARADARVIITGVVPTPLFDTGTSTPDREAELAGLRAWRLGQTVQSVEGDNLVMAVPLYKGNKVAATLVAQRQLTEVAAVVGLVRNALLAAAAIGLAVAVGLGLALSGTLTRRLGRLRRAALRITREGPEAPTLRDMGRDEVGDLARALARMQEELRHQEAARRSFVATASHELRTPLTMLQGTMELLDEDLRGGLDIEDAQQQVTNARRELRRLSALASELLDLSRLDAAVQLRSEPVELGELARAVAAEFGLRAAEREVPIEVVPPPGPCWAKADPAACARVVRILIDNALRYAPAGEPIVVLAEQLGDRMIVEVADRGPGVPEDERERIFERFHRGRASGAESGFGLGLAIGRELAERMNGTLLLEDSDVGACFQLALPATTGSSPAPSPAPDSAAAA